MIQVLSVEDLGQLDGKYPDMLIQHIRVLLSNLQSADPSRPVSHYGSVAILEEPADFAATGAPNIDSALAALQRGGFEFVNVIDSGASARFYHALMLANNEYGVDLIIPAQSWLPRALALVLEREADG